MSVLEEMRKRIKQSNIESSKTKSNTLDEMRKRVETKKQEVEAHNKKVQDFNQYIKENDVSNIKRLQLPNPLSSERVRELAIQERAKQEEVEYYKNNPATIGSNLDRNLLQPAQRTIRNMLIAAGDSAVDIGEYVYETLGPAIPIHEVANNKTDKTLEEMIRERKETPSQLAQYTESVRQKALERTQELPNQFARKVAEGGMVVGDMLPSIALGVTPLGAYGSSIGIFARSASNAQQEALNNGATYEQARLNGVLNGLLETVVEMIGGKALGKLTKMPTLASKFGGKLLSKAPKGVKTFLELLKDVGEEGLEEMISDFVQPYINRVTYNPEAPLASFKSQWEAFSSSIIPSLMFAGINVGASNVISYVDKQMTANSVNKQIDNLANKQIEQIENTDLSMVEKISLINEVKKQQIQAKNNFTTEINKFEVKYPEKYKAIDAQIVNKNVNKNLDELRTKYNVEITPDGTTNLLDRLKIKYNVQNGTNFEKTSPNTVQLDENNVQNALDFKKTVQNNSTIQGLEDYTEQDIKDLVSDYIQNLDTNVQIKGIAINGSRARGDSQVTSDLDVVVEYDGDMSEDALFNILNEEPLTIEGIQVDINPITASKSGTLEQYMQKSKEYDNSKNVDIMKDREYNSYRTVERKEDYKEGEIHASFTLQPSEFEQVRSEVSQNRRNDQDGLHYIDLSKNGYFSYIYKKQGDSITPIVQLRGHEDVLNFVRRRIENGNYKEYGTARRWSSVIRNEYRNYNGDISDMQYERQTDKNDVDNGRQNRQQSKDNRRRIDNRSEENSTTIENSEEQGSFSISESDNVRYDTIPVLKDGFYSQLENVIINKMQRQAKAEDVMNLIRKNGVKQDEIDWTGIDDFLANKETVTKDEVIEYISANQIEIEEVVKDDSERKRFRKREEKINERRKELEDEMRELLDFYLVTRDGSPMSTLYHHMIRTAWEDEEFTTLVDLTKFDKVGDRYLYENYEEGARSFTKEEMLKDMRKMGKLYKKFGKLNTELETMENEGWKSDGSDTKFQEYATNWQDEHDNYREVLFTLPNIKGANNFSSVHWNEKNVLAHTRLNDYNDTDGNKVLFIEEIQSDLHQEGRKKGYYKNTLDEVRVERDELQAKIAPLMAKKETRKKELGELAREKYQKEFEKQTQNREKAIKILEKYREILSPKNSRIERRIEEMREIFDETYRIIARRQRGIPKGYTVLAPVNTSDILDSEYNEFLDFLMKLNRELTVEDFKNLREDLKDYIDYEWNGYFYRSNGITQLWKDKINNEHLNMLNEDKEFNNLQKEIDELEQRVRTLTSKIIKNETLPSSIFPFKKNWHEFVLRKIINEAVQQGYDKVAWTTGKQQNDRYNLAKYVDAIEYYENGKSYDIYVYQDGAVIRKFEEYPQEQLEELVGKEIATKMINREGEPKEIKSLFYNTNTREGYILSGIDLEIGGEGMKGFYDKIIPEYLSKYLKKWNSKVEEVVIPDYQGNKHIQQGFTITPEMINSIKKTGQSLYDKQIDDLTRDNIIQKIVDTLNVDIKSNKATLKQVASEIRTLIKGNQFTIDNIDRIISELGNKLKAVNAPEQKGQRRRSLATYWVEELGYDSWHEVAEELKAQLIELRNDYGELETDKKAIAASPEIRDVLKQAGFTEFEIYDPANAYIQNILEILEKDKDYYAKTLKQIEQETFVTGEKRMNTILNKRRHDVQSGKTPVNPNYLKGASLSSMRKEVEKYLGKKVGLKGFRKRAYGIYKLNLDTIRVKDISNMETTIHELGHRINFKELDKDLEGASRKELNELAERAFLNMYDDEPAVKLQEGWAEFTKRFVVDNQTTLKEYPELSNYMLEQLSNNPRVEKVITSLIDMAEQYVNAPTEAQIRKMQSIGEDTGKQEERGFFDKYMYEVHDDLWDIKQMTRAFAKSMNTSIWKLAPSDNVYNLMRTLRANEDRVLNVMKFGLIDDSGIRRTKGMAEIMERLNNDPEKAQRVRDLLIAMRTLDYASVSLETGLAPEEALSLIAKYSKDTDVMNAANDIINFQEEIMKYAVSKGLMKVEDYQEMKKWNKLYIPLKRVFEGKTNSSNSKMGAGNLTKRRTGSTREIIDPFESIIQNTAMILTKINQNEIIKTLADLQQKTGLADYFEEVDPGQRLKAEVSLEMFQGVLEAEGVDTDEIDLDVVKRIFSPVMNDDKTMTIGYMDNGKLKAIEFKDKNIYDVLTGADNGLISKTNLVLNALDKFTGLLRLGATTGNLEFALPNMVADTTAAWIFSESGFIPAVDTMRGLVDYMVANYDWAGKLVKEGKYKQNNKYMYDLYKQSGATMATRVASYRPEVQEYVLEVFGKHVNDLMSADLSKAKKAGKAILNGILKAPQKVQDILSIIPELSEQATRFESFKKDYNYFKKKGYSHKNALLQATSNTRDITMDFNRMGHSMRAYNRIKAFSAARAQGIYRFIEGVEKMPKKVLSKVGILTAISLSILAAANASGNDKEKEITDQKRKDNFIIPLGANGDIITIKKPQGTVRSIINFAELIYNVGTGKIKEENYNQAWLNWVRDTVQENSPIELDLKEGNDFYSTISSATLPTALEPIIENALNRDFYYGNPIIPYGKEKLRPEDQYDENTSQTAILIGKALKQSPAKVENLITGWLAGVGQQVLDISDFVLGKTVPSIPEAPKKNKDEAFITKRFFVSGYKNSESISQVYDMIEKLEDLKEYNEATEEQLKQLKQLNAAKETMSLLNKKMKAIRNDLSLSAKQKQKEILKLQELRTDTARYYLGKTLIKNTNKRQIELYEYYPASTEYKYKPKNGLQVNVQYTEKDQQRYAEIWKETYEEELLKFETSKKYYTMSDEEREKEIESIRTKARNKAQDEVSKEVYEREH